MMVKKENIFRGIRIMWLFIALILMFFYGLSHKATTLSYAEPPPLSISDEPIPLENPPYSKEVMNGIKEETKRLSNMNEDVVGYLYLEGYISEPVMFTPDDMDYYLRNGIDKEYDIPGLPFLSSYGNGNFSQNELIYGHSMTDRSRFGGLMFDVTTEEIAESLSELVVYYEPTDEFIVYNLSYVFTVIDGEEFIVLNKFDSAEQRGRYNKEWYERSYMQLDVADEDFEKHTLFLQTCKEYNGVIRSAFAFIEADRGVYDG